MGWIPRTDQEAKREIAKLAPNVAKEILERYEWYTGMLVGAYDPESAYRSCVKKCSNNSHDDFCKQ